MILSCDPLSTIPEPHRWFYADRRRRRPVRVCVMKFYGVGQHFHVSIEEEDDAVWDSRDAAGWGKPGQPNGWTRPRCSPRNGRRFDFKRRFFDTALEEARKILLKHFPRKTHRWDFQNWSEEGRRARRWFYKEGD